MIYVIDKNGNPLMPTERCGKIRHLLKNGQAKVLKSKPFTIKLLYNTTNYKQNITLGIDAGYQHIGFSAITDKKELISGEVELLTGMSKRLKERAIIYRRARRNRLRYRKPKFSNRKNKKEGWLAPSIQHKLDSHVRIINRIKSILPITKTIIEVANFDIQKIKNPDIHGKEYQQGERHGIDTNLQQYILLRDEYKCQNPDCKHLNDKKIILQVHHIKFRSNGGTDSPSNLITLCSKCHTPRAHLKGGYLTTWEPKVKQFKAETFMNTIRKRLVGLIGCDYTYGYITKNKRREFNIEKTHYNDAFVIAGGNYQERIKPFKVTQVRRNNRSLTSFCDAKYIDIRTGEKASGKELCSGRRNRNKELNTENLRVYRGKKIKKGKYTDPRKRYLQQTGDMVIWDNKKFICGGTQSYGKEVILKDFDHNLVKIVNAKSVQVCYHSKGFFFV